MDSCLSGRVVAVRQESRRIRRQEPSPGLAIGLIYEPSPGATVDWARGNHRGRVSAPKEQEAESSFIAALSALRHGLGWACMKWLPYRFGGRGRFVATRLSEGLLTCLFGEVNVEKGDVYPIVYLFAT